MNDVGTYNYSYIKGDTFTKLFPAYKENATNGDPIGAVAKLNALLATSYNDAAIAQKRKQCEAVATSCIESMCGSDYAGCYRNRNDVYVDTYAENAATPTGFADSMNRVSGVLDRTIVIGMCAQTVRNATACEDVLAIEIRNAEKNAATQSTWGGIAGEAWLDAGRGVTYDTGMVPKTDENGREICTNLDGEEGVCGGKFLDHVMISRATYNMDQATNSLFNSLLVTIEKNAQASYQMALTREQNACNAMGRGSGIRGSDDDATYQWVKLRGKVPYDYAIEGLRTSNFTSSNDLSGSFCRVRVTMTSSDPKINAIIKKQGWNERFFAANDTFMCGSWVNWDTLDAEAGKVGDAAKKSTEDSLKKVRPWVEVGSALLGSGGGAWLGNSISNGKTLGGLTNIRSSSCVTNVGQAYNVVKTMKSENFDSVKSAVSGYVTAAGLGETNPIVSALNGCEKTKAADCKSTLQAMLQDSKAVCNSGLGVGAKNGITWGTSAVGALATWGVSHLAMKDIIEAKKDSAYTDAYNDFMEKFGSNISCYVGDSEMIPFGGAINIVLEQ